MFAKIFGLVLIIVGIIMPIKSESFFRAFGRVPWAEKYLGVEGGSRLFYKLLGIIMIFFGLTLLFDMFGGIVSFVLGPILPK